MFPNCQIKVVDWNAENKANDGVINHKVFEVSVSIFLQSFLFYRITIFDSLLMFMCV